MDIFRAYKVYVNNLIIDGDNIHSQTFI
jgi:hypothetical protein